MNAKSNRIFNMIERVIGFLIANLTAAAPARLTEAQTELVSLKDALADAAESQVYGAGHSSGGVDGRETTSRALRNVLLDVTRTGRTISEENPELGLGPIFRMPRSGSYTALVAGTNAITAAATSIQPLFVEAGLPATFLTEVQTLLTAFQTATRNKTNGGITRVGGTSGLDLKARAAVRVAKKLDTYVRNHFRGNTEKLAAWKHARRIERAPVRNNAPSSATPAVVANPQA